MTFEGVIGPADIVWTTGMEIYDAEMPNGERIVLLRFKQDESKSVWYGVLAASFPDLLEAFAETLEKIQRREEPAVTLRRIPSNGNGKVHGTES